MLVKSRSHSPAVIVEYNGVRYMFTNDGKPVDIPVEALINAYKSGHIHSHELVPVEQEDISKLREENKILKTEIENLNNIIADLEKRIKKDARKK